MKSNRCYVAIVLTVTGLLLCGLPTSGSGQRAFKTRRVHHPESVRRVGVPSEAPPTAAVRSPEHDPAIVPASPAAGPVTVTATAGTLGPTDYASLAAAFSAINAGTHQGVITISIVGDTAEPASAVLNASGTGSASYTSVAVTPTGVRTVSGTIFSAPLIDLNGADNVTIDGKNTGGNSLTITNLGNDSNASISTIRFINGAQNNTIKNCTILGSGTSNLGIAGGTLLFSTTLSVGNNNNTISHNNIGPAAGGLPTKGIEALGTATNSSTINTANLIDSNNIFDFFNTGGDTAGIDVRVGNRNWTISNNHLYQTVSRTFIANGIYSGITINGTTGGTGDFHTLSGNVIGFSAANNTGTTTINGSTNQLRPINIINLGSGTATLVQNNTISGIDQTTAFNGGFSGAAGFVAIDTPGSALMNVSGNTIGSLDGSSTIGVHDPGATSSWLVIGIRGSNTADTISGNNIGAFSIDGLATNVIGFQGITHESSGVGISISGNTIGGPTVAGGISNAITSNYEMDGIRVNNADPAVTGNVVRNMTAALNAQIYGIIVNANNFIGSTVSQNVVHSLKARNVYGIAPQLGVPVTGTNRIERNFIHSLSSTGSNNQILGMYLPNNSNLIVTNNMIRLGLDATGASITTPEDMEGIQDQNGGIREYYYNNIYIGGSVTGANNDTMAFGNFNSGTRTFKDNIFWNARSSSTGTAKNYAIYVNGTVAGMTSDFNDLFVTGTNGFVGRTSSNQSGLLTLTDWRTATLLDANSISADPQYLNPTGTASTVNLHVLASSPVVLKGTTVAATNIDFDGQTRPATPAIGADQPLFTTAAAVSVSGRALNAYGQGIRNASVTLIALDGSTRISRTNAFGYYVFNDVVSGQVVTLSARARGYQFVTRVVNVVDQLTDLDLVADH